MKKLHALGSISDKHSRRTVSQDSTAHVLKVHVKELSWILNLMSTSSYAKTLNVGKKCFITVFNSQIQVHLLICLGFSLTIVNWTF